MERTIDQKMKYECNEFNRYLRGRQNCKIGLAAYKNVQDQVLPVLQILNMHYDGQSDDFIREKRSEVNRLIGIIDDRIYGEESEIIGVNEAEILAECDYYLRKTNGYMYDELDRRSGKHAYNYIELSA